MYTYEIKIRFNTDLELTPAELDNLVFASATQIDEPSDHLGESKRARFTTRNVETETTSIISRIEKK